MIKITVNQGDFNRILTALERVKKVVVDQKNRIPLDSAIAFSKQLRKNIVEQTYSDFGHPRTASWKKAFSNSSQYWLWLGTAMKSINYWSVDNSPIRTSYFVGFKYVGGAIVQGAARPTKRTVVKRKEVKSTQRPTSATERRHEAMSTLRHISIEGYVPQTKVHSQSLTNPLLVKKREREENS
jgi:hypothetical protein